ncbi:MAG: cadherin-like domain-containing protein, partial [Anaerolineales bacterium]|nr:cadherin-like domain-containing protein [Anaerolineales bacterium]
TISGTCTDPFLPGGTTPTTITVFFGPTIEGSPPEIGTAQCLAGDPVDTWSFSGQSTNPDPLLTTPDPLLENFVSAESALQGFSEAFPVSFAGQNNAPVAVDDAFPTNDGSLNVAAPGVLANDLDADFDPLTAVLLSDVTNGTLVLNPDGSFTYAAGATYAGSDTFTYQVDDGKELSADFATVTISGNIPPVALDDTYATLQNTPLTVNDVGTLGNGVLFNDTDADNNTLSVSAVEGVPIGNLIFPITLPSGASLALNVNGSFTYTPPENTDVIDSFTYVANDGLADSNLATVTIIVGNPNQPPVAADDAYATLQNTDLIVAAPGVLFNDTDADNDPLSVSAVNGDPANVGVEITLASGASLALNVNGSFTYTPLFNFTGTDSFTYVANDGTVDSNTATVTISVKDTVTVTSASYRTRRDRWQIQGTVSDSTSQVEVYLCEAGVCTAPQLIGAANVNNIDGSWNLNGAGAVAAVADRGDTVFAVSSSGGESPAVLVDVRR